MKNKKIIIFFSKPFFRHILMPTLLFLGAIIFTVYLILQSSFTVLNFGHPSITLPTKDFLKGEIITNSFQAYDHNLGSIGVRFYNLGRINSDEVIFRIKEENSQYWFYEHIYKSDQFQPHQYFPFGFSLQPDSAGKKYVFEIESLYGEEGNSIQVSSQMPQVSTQYQFSKQEILSSYSNFFGFLVKKVLNLVQNIELVMQSLLSFFPFLIYLAWIYRPGWFRSYSQSSYLSLRELITRYPLLTLFTLFLYIFIFLIHAYMSVLLLIIIGIGFFISRIYKLGSRGLFIQALLMLIICPLLVSLHYTVPAETAALFAFCFLTGGVLYSYIELR